MHEYSDGTEEEDDLIGLNENEEYEENDYDLEYEYLNDLLDLGAVTIPSVPKISMPSFPSYTTPTMPKPPVSVANVEKHFKKLKTWYDEVTGKTFKFYYGSKLIQAKGLGNFFLTGASKIAGWYTIKSCGGLDVGCVISNIKKMFSAVDHSRAFLAYASQLVSNYIATGIDLNTKAGKDILKNIAALPDAIKKWFTDLQKNYTKALKDYNKSIQDKMTKTVQKVRDNINNAFKDAEKQFKKLLNKASDAVQKKLKDFQTQIKNAQNDFNAKVTDVKTQITNATNDFKSNLKIVNDEVEKAKKAVDKINTDVDKIKKWSLEVETRIKKLEDKVKIPTAPPETDLLSMYSPEELLKLPQKLLELPSKFMSELV